MTSSHVAPTSSGASLSKHDQDEFLGRTDAVAGRYHKRWLQFRAAEIFLAMLICGLTAYAGWYQKSAYVDPKDPQATSKQERIKTITLTMTSFAALLVAVNSASSLGSLAFAYRTARNEMRDLRIEVLENKVMTTAALERRINAIEDKKGQAAKPFAMS